MLAMGMDGDHKRLKQRCKIVNLARKFLRSGRIKASVRCSNLLAKGHIGCHLACLDFSFVEDRNGKKFPGKDVVKGFFVAVYVGMTKKRFVIPVFYFNHPLFDCFVQQAEQATRKEFVFLKIHGIIV